jgi:hypothetical protein
MITAKHINAQGMVPLWEATDDGHRQVMLAPVDATHALSVDPKRWSLEKPETGERSASEFGGESQSGAGDLSQTADPYEPNTGERSDSEKGSG